MISAIQTEVREALRKRGFAVIKNAIDPALLEKATVKAHETIRQFSSELTQLQNAGALPYCLPLPTKEHFPLLDPAEA